MKDIKDLIRELENERGYRWISITDMLKILKLIQNEFEQLEQYITRVKNERR